MQDNLYTMLVFGNNGAEAFDYVSGVYAGAVDRALLHYGTGCSAVFVSGGGNDFAGFNDLRPILGVDCNACLTEEACFNHGAEPGTIEVDQFSLRLADLQTTYAGRVVFVDSRGTLDPTDWANELHPTAGGFGRIARQKWKPALASAGVL